VQIYNILLNNRRKIQIFFQEIEKCCHSVGYLPFYLTFTAQQAQLAKYQLKVCGFAFE